MELNVDLENLRRLFEAGLPSELQEGGEYHELRVRLTHEVLVYGADVLPRRIFEKTSGKEIAAMVCEDIEGAVRLLPLLEPTLVQPPTPAPEERPEAEEGEEPPEPEVPDPIVVRPRVVHLSDGWGLPSVVLAVLRPEQKVEIIEADDRRDWFWRRLQRVFSLRNLEIRVVGDLDAWARENRETVDLLLLKRRSVDEALTLGLPLLEPGGRLASWQMRDEEARVRRPIVDPRGERIELDESYAFQSAVARPRTLLCVGCAEAERSGVATS